MQEFPAGAFKYNQNAPSLNTRTGMKTAKVSISGGKKPADQEELLEKFERMKNWIEILKAER